MSTLEDAQRQMLPLLRLLVDQLRSDGNTDVATFFDGVRRSIEQARDEEDLADPFMALVTTCEIVPGSGMAPTNVILADQVLEQAVRISQRLARRSTLH